MAVGIWAATPEGSALPRLPDGAPQYQEVVVVEGVPTAELYRGPAFGWPKPGSRPRASFSKTTWQWGAPL